MKRTRKLLPEHKPTGDSNSPLGSHSCTLCKGMTMVVKDSKQEIETLRNIEYGQHALKRGLKVFACIGLAPKTRATTPLYRAVPGEPGVFIRSVGGKEVKGRVMRGRFVLVKTSK